MLAKSNREETKGGEAEKISLKPPLLFFVVCTNLFRSDLECALNRHH
jgi:hypothetical protein